jgi:phosphoglycolate phosphatase-like HAD superfamily hydrolase
MNRSSLRVVFIDDGGVMNDNARRGAQWRRLVGEYLTPRLGGTPESWAAANVGAAERSWQRQLAEMRDPRASGVDAFTRADRARWLADMCAQVGVPTPPDAEALAIAAHDFVTERVHADLPGAIAAIRALGSLGKRLHTATGEQSWEVDGYLRGMGVRALFDRLYGPDLVDRYKSGPHYYEAILAHSRTDPATAVVVEDSDAARAWAASVGLRSYASLPELLAALG